jgi:hypothetical protein
MITCAPWFEKDFASEEESAEEGELSSEDISEDE